ncbi:MAG: dihydroorotase [Desulfobacteraceae bacterium]
MATWIRGGRVVDPLRGRIEDLDIVVERGRIKDMLQPGGLTEVPPRVKIIDASGRLVLPGLIDMHVHLREPGHEYKETVESGSRAGVAGGFTALACMPNTDPVNDSRSVTEFILRQARSAGYLKVHPVAAITMGQKGEVLTEFGDLKQAGAVGVSDDGRPVLSSQVMRRALEYGRFHGLIVISHCEDTSLSSEGAMHEGKVSTKIGLRGIPAAAEEIMVYRDINLSRLTGCPVHIAHVSTRGSVELIRRAKEEGLPVTAETAPHYFTLDHTAVIGYRTEAKMNPPLRTPEDVQAVKEGLARDVIDAIATDHAPHSPLEKDVEFEQAAFGIIGLETALPLTLALVEQGVLSLPEAVKKLTVNPARILGVDGGLLNKGASADLTIVDPDVEFVLSAGELQSRSSNSPFLGIPLRGRAELTMVGGRIVWKRSPAHPGGGR